MTALRDLQRDFQAYVLGDASAPPAAVDGTGAVSATDRLNVYADAIRLRFLEVLGQDYPGLHTLAGDDEFRSLGLAYVAAHPSHHPSIRWFGRHLHEFLRATAPWRDHPVLAEMARFEWAKGELLDAADSPVVGIEDIAAIPPDRWAGIRPRLKPAVRRLALEWNVPSLWKAIDERRRATSARPHRTGRWTGCCGAKRDRRPVALHRARRGVGARALRSRRGFRLDLHRAVRTGRRRFGRVSRSHLPQAVGGRQRAGGGMSPRAVRPSAGSVRGRWRLSARPGVWCGPSLTTTKHPPRIDVPVPGSILFAPRNDRRSAQ